MKQSRHTEHNYLNNYDVTAVMTFGENFVQSQHGSWTNLQNFNFVDTWEFSDFLEFFSD